MQTRTLKTTGWEVSEIGLGCWPLGGQYGEVSRAQAIATVHAALDLGINLLDTADAYGLVMGTSEEIVGEALSERSQEDVYVATKVGNWGRRFGHPLSFAHPLHVILCCEASLRRLRRERIDFYQCHIGDLTEPDVFLEAFNSLLEQGKIGSYGISTDRLDVARAFNREGKCTVCQLDYSYLNRDAEAELLPWCEANGVGTFIRGPLAQGLLSGKYGKQSTFTDQVRQSWNSPEQRSAFEAKLLQVEAFREQYGEGRPLAASALRFCLEHSAVTSVIPGAKSPEQLRELVLG